MVKFIHFPIINQTWARLVIYTLISMIFMDWKIAGKGLFSLLGITLALINVIHIYSSYIGFANLESGVSYSIFYIYPLLILLFSATKMQWIYFVPLIGVGLLTYSGWSSLLSNNFTKGLAGIIVSTLTEVAMYFIVRKMKINNKWNILFIAYLLPAIILSAILNKNVLPKNKSNNNNIDSTNETDENKENKWNKDVIFLLLGNAIIGALGYYLRFYTIEKLPVVVYSSLSYFGIIMAYFYGWELNKETLDWKKAIGSLLIIISGIASNI